MGTMHVDLGRVHLYRGDSLDVLKSIPDNSVDSVVTDPPYGLSQLTKSIIVAALTAWIGGKQFVPDASIKGFMGRTWDGFVPDPALWEEVYRVLKPGGHTLCFAGTRTADLMGVSLRLAGFEIRDTFDVNGWTFANLEWCYGSGFPKSLDISKGIDKAVGAERKVVGERTFFGKAAQDWKDKGGDTFNAAAPSSAGCVKTVDVTAPESTEAQAWAGWGTALKPAHEPIIVARKPLGEASSDQLRATTAQDYWVTGTDDKKNTPKFRLAMRKKGVVIPPAHVEGKLVVQKRKALHAGVEDHDLVELHALRQDRARPTPPHVVGRAGVRAYRPWKTETLVANTLVYGTGGLNIDGCRVAPTTATYRCMDCGHEENDAPSTPNGTCPTCGSVRMQGVRVETITNHSRGSESAKSKGIYGDSEAQETHQTAGQALGRWPPNKLLVHHPDCVCTGTKSVAASSGIRPADVGTDYGVAHKSGSMAGAKGVLLGATYCDEHGNETVAAWTCAPGCPVAALDAQSGTLKRGHTPKARGKGSQISGASGHTGQEGLDEHYGTEGGASRFFPSFAFTDEDFVPFLYQAKAPRSEREAGCQDLHARTGAEAIDREEGSDGLKSPRAGAGRTAGQVRNFHPTVKPVALMRWLCRLVTPPGGTVLDPFCGSGTTGVAAVHEGFGFVGIERDSDSKGNALGYFPILEARVKHALSEVESKTGAKVTSTPKRTFSAQLNPAILDIVGSATAIHLAESNLSDLPPTPSPSPTTEPRVNLEEEMGGPIGPPVPPPHPSPHPFPPRTSLPEFLARLRAAT